MLQNLHISKYVLIDNLDIQFHSGFSIITGETGAGKSILLGALNLLLGQRSDAKSIKKGAQKCIIEGTFSIKDYRLASFFDQHELDFDENECIIRREINSSGKSRAFINDTPVTLPLLKELGTHLVDIHSQHQNLLLSGKPFQLGILDAMAQNTDLLHRYKDCYAQYLHLKHEIKRLEDETEQRLKDEDFIRFQANQLNEANLRNGEQAELEAEAEVLSHANDIKETLYEIYSNFNSEGSSLEQKLKQSINKLEHISDWSANFEQLTERLQSIYIELKDILSDIIRLQEDIQDNPQRLEQVNERLNLIYALQQKHNVNTIESLLLLQKDFNEQLEALSTSDETIRQKQQELENIKTQLLSIAQSITKGRTAAAHQVEAELKKRLIPLGIPNVQFAVRLTPLASPSESGMDQIEFLFSGNKNVEMQDISQIASGGEIARVMLSLKALIAKKISCPTIFFDEIDTGVSGRIAECMASTMKEMGRYCQVISITHLPQIASTGEHHYLVYKEDNAEETQSHIIHLTREQRINEIAHMLSGSVITEAAINNARELLKHSEH